MKLVSRPISFTFKKPLITAYGHVAERQGVLVSIDADGVIGRGEAMPLPAFGSETLEASRAAIGAFEVRALPSTLSELEAMTAHLSSTPAARSAIEGALIEHLSLRSKTPIVTLLGGAATRSVRVNALLEGETAAALAAAAKQAVEAGFTTLKVKVAARPLSIDAQRLFAVRTAVGPDVRIRIDANGGWSESAARAALRGLEAIGIELCEQPVVARDVDSLRRVCQGVPCVIAADEVLLVRSADERVLEKYPVPAAQVVVLKPMVLGGVLPALALAKRARAAGVASYVTTSLDGPLARAAAVLLASVVGGPYAHGLSTLELFNEAGIDRYTPVRGEIATYEQLGWGV